MLLKNLYFSVFKDYQRKQLLVLNFSLFICLSTPSFSQIFLQLESSTSVKSQKFAVGDVLEYSTVEFPKDFYKSEIIELDPEMNIILFDDGYFKLDQLYKLKFERSKVKMFGAGLLQFSAGWFLYGGLATLTQDNFTMDKGQIIIGAVIAAVGYGIRKIFGKRRVKLGKKNRLRIVDLRFSVEPDRP